MADITASVAIVDGTETIEIVNGEMGKLLGCKSGPLCGAKITHNLTCPSPGQPIERLRQATAIAAEPWNKQNNNSMVEVYEVNINITVYPRPDFVPSGSALFDSYYPSGHRYQSAWSKR